MVFETNQEYSFLKVDLTWNDIQVHFFPRFLGNSLHFSSKN